MLWYLLLNLRSKWGFHHNIKIQPCPQMTRVCMISPLSFFTSIFLCLGTVVAITLTRLFLVFQVRLYKKHRNELNEYKKKIEININTQKNIEINRVGGCTPVYIQHTTYKKLFLTWWDFCWAINFSSKLEIGIRCRYHLATRIAYISPWCIIRLFRPPVIFLTKSS